MRENTDDATSDTYSEPDDDVMEAFDQFDASYAPNQGASTSAQSLCATSFDVASTSGKSAILWSRGTSESLITMFYVSIQSPRRTITTRTRQSGTQ